MWTSPRGNRNRRVLSCLFRIHSKKKNCTDTACHCISELALGWNILRVKKDLRCQQTTKYENFNGNSRDIVCESILMVCKGSFTINVRRKFRFLRLLPTFLLPRTKMSARERYQNENARTFLKISRPALPPRMSVRSDIKAGRGGMEGAGNPEVRNSNGHFVWIESNWTKRSRHF